MSRADRRGRGGRRRCRRTRPDPPRRHGRRSDAPDRHRDRRRARRPTAGPAPRPRPRTAEPPTCSGLEGLAGPLPDPGRALRLPQPARPRRRPGRRRDRPDHPEGRDPRARRGVGLRQDDDRPGRREADPPDRRPDRLRRRGRLRPLGHAAAARLPAARPADLPGPVRDAEPEAHDRRVRRGAADRQPPRPIAARSRRDGRSRPSRRRGSGRPPTSPAATRTSCPAASGSGSSSRARS